MSLNARRRNPPPAADPLLTAPILLTLLLFARPNLGATLATALVAIAEAVYVGSFGVCRRWRAWPWCSRWNLFTYVDGPARFWEPA